jgi:hypothetical protein
MNMMKVTRWEFPCVLENSLLYIRDCSGLSFATKGLGHLAALYYTCYLLLVTNYLAIETIYYRYFQYLQRIPCWKPLVISFCSSFGSTLLLIKRTMIDPLYLWVIKTLFWRHCRGVKSLWWVEFGKETFILRAEIYCHLSLRKVILWGACSGYLHLDRKQ